MVSHEVKPKATTKNMWLCQYKYFYFSFKPTGKVFQVCGAKNY